MGILRTTTAIGKSAAIALTILTSSASAQEAFKPTRNVEFMIPLAPGGGTDLATRQVVQIMDKHELLPTSMTVVNKPGAGSALGYVYLTQHEGDGHYIGVGMVPLYTNAMQGKHSLSYNDLTMIANLYSEPTSFFVREESELKSGADLVERLRNDPSSVTIGLNSIGSGHHLAIAQVMAEAGGDPTKLKIVTFNSSGENAVAVRGGHVDVGVGSAASGVSQLQAGGMRVIAVASADRMGGGLSEVPTWKEQGIDVVSENWRGIVGPPGMTDAQVEFWRGVFEKLVQTAEWKALVEENGWTDAFSGPKEFLEFVRVQEASDREMLTRLGLVK